MQSIALFDYPISFSWWSRCRHCWLPCNLPCRRRRDDLLCVLQMEESECLLWLWWIWSVSLMYVCVVCRLVLMAVHGIVNPERFHLSPIPICRQMWLYPYCKLFTILCLVKPTIDVFFLPYRQLCLWYDCCGWCVHVCMFCMFCMLVLFYLTLTLCATFLKM